jgi:phosphoglycolate phosphatase-like HAD superfamily hydrolase
MIELAVLDIAGTTVEEHGAVYVALEEAVRAAGGRPSTADIQHWMGADKREAITVLLTEGLGRAPETGTVDAAVTDFRSRLDAAYTERVPTPLPAFPRRSPCCAPPGSKWLSPPGSTAG